MKDDILGLVFTLLDKALYSLGKLPFWPLRGYSRRLAVKWILERQEKEGDWVSFNFSEHDPLFYQDHRLHVSLLLEHAVIASQTLNKEMN